MSRDPLPGPEAAAELAATLALTLVEAREDLEGLLADVLGAVFEEEVEVLPEGFDVHVDGPLGTDAAGSDPDAAALLAVHDDVTGADLGVQVRVSRVLARRLAARMFGVEEPTSEDLLDAVGELGNIAGGNVKSLLFPGQTVARLSLPSAVLGGPVGPPPRRGRADGDPGVASMRALVLGEPVELVLAPDVEASGLVWPPSPLSDVQPEVLEGQL